MKSYSFPRSRSIWGTSLLIIGVNAIIAMIIMHLNSSFTIGDDVHHDLPEHLVNLLFYTIGVISFWNKVLAIRQKVNPITQLAAITLPLIQVTLAIASTTMWNGQMTVTVNMSDYSQAFIGGLTVLWLVSWWAFDVVDFFQHGLKHLS